MQCYLVSESLNPDVQSLVQSYFILVEVTKIYSHTHSLRLFQKDFYLFSQKEDVNLLHRNRSFI